MTGAVHDWELPEHEREALLMAQEDGNTQHVYSRLAVALADLNTAEKAHAYSVSVAEKARAEFDAAWRDNAECLYCGSEVRRGTPRCEPSCRAAGHG